MVLSVGEAHGSVPIMSSFSTAVPLPALELGRDALDDDVEKDTTLPPIWANKTSRSLSVVTGVDALAGELLF